MKQLTSLVLAVLGAASSVVSVDVRAGDPPALNALSPTDKKSCSGTASVFLALERERDMGADRSLAINNVTRQVDQQGRIGSHLPKQSHLQAVQGYAEFVYRHPEMRGEALMAKGLYGCALSRLAVDDPHFDKGEDALDALIGACQAKNAAAQNGAVGSCIEAGVGPVLDTAAAKPSHP